FFSVWTIQRKQEIAVLRAIGAPVLYLLRDGLGQAALLLVIFTAVGIGLGVGMGTAMPDGMPFVLEAGPIAVAATLTIGVGVVWARRLPRFCAPPVLTRSPHVEAIDETTNATTDGNTRGSQFRLGADLPRRIFGAWRWHPKGSSLRQRQPACS